MKKVLSIILMIVMILSMFPVSALAEEPIVAETAGEGSVFECDNIIVLRAALAGTVYDTVKLTADINVSDSCLVASHDVTLDLNGHILNRGNGGRVFEVNANTTLTLKDSSPNSPHYYKVGSHNRWEITTNSNDISAAVPLSTLTTIPNEGTVISISGGAFYGGSYTNGGGVHIFGGGSFIMDSGSIVGCHSDYGGGVYVNPGAVFTMNGGAILGCDVDDRGAGVMNLGTATVNGGLIAYNNNWKKHNEYWSGTGGGVANEATFVMTGGKISGNKAHYGAGIGNRYPIQDECTCTITGGTVSYNTANVDGGGVYQDGNKFETRISGDGVEISNNSARYGGGLYGCDGTIIMTGGTVSGNTATDLAGGAYNNSTFIVGGQAKITGNTKGNSVQNLYLCDNRYITVSSDTPLNGNALIGVTQPASTKRFTVGNTYGYAKYFSSDEGGVLINNNGYVEVVDSSTKIPIEGSDGGRFTSAGWSTAASHAAATGSVTLKLVGTVSVDAGVIVNNGQTLKIDLNGQELGNPSSGNPQDIFTVNSGGKLEVGNSTGTGVIGRKENTNYGRCLVVNSGGSATLENCKICHFYTTTANGGAVCVNGGTVVLTDCYIQSDNAANGGGIFMTGGANLTMTGGGLSDCNGQNNGGLLVADGSAKAYFKNVSFEGGSARDYGKTFYVRGSETDPSAVTVSLEDCTITQSDGVVNFNDIDFCNATLSMKDSSYNASSTNNNSTTFVISNGVFTMNGGSLSASYSPRIVSVSGTSTVNLSGAAKITGNSNTNLYLDGSSITVNAALTQGANVCVRLSGRGGLFAKGTGSQYFHSDYSDDLVYTKDVGGETWIGFDYVPGVPSITWSNQEGTSLLSWTAVPGAASYDIYRSLVSDGDYTELGNTASTSYTDTTAVIGTKYYYKVKAVSERQQKSDYSNVASGKIGTQTNYAIIYDANGGSNAPSYQFKSKGTSLVLSTDEPAKSGATFKGWATSKTATIALYQPGDSFFVDADTVLYAVWSTNRSYKNISGLESPTGNDHIYTKENSDKQYWWYTDASAASLKVTFDSRTSFYGHPNGVGQYDYFYIYDGTGKQIGKYTGTQLAGQTITIQSDTVGFYMEVDTNFQYTDDRRKDKWGFKVTNIEATPKTLTVSFNSTGGTATNSQSIQYGKTLTKPADPTRENCIFDGWLLNGKPFDFRTQIKRDITLTAKWKLAPIGNGDAVYTLYTDPNSNTTAKLELPGSGRYPGMTVSGLETLTKELKDVNQSKNVTVSFGIGSSADNSENSEQNSIKALATGKDGFTFLNISLTTKFGDDAATALTDTEGHILEITIPFDLSGKKWPVIYRYHDGVAQAFTQAASGSANYGKDGTYCIEGEGSSAVIRFFADKFSEYAVGYDTKDTSGASVSLNGTLGVNFYVDADYYLGDPTKYADAYVEVTYNHNTANTDANVKTDTILLKNCERDSKTNMYKISCTTTAGQMTEMMSVRFYSGKNTEPLYRGITSVELYCEDVIRTYANSEENQKLVALCKSILDYGIASQQFFNCRTGSLPNNGSYLRLSEYQDSYLQGIVNYDSGSMGGNITGTEFMALFGSALRIYYDNYSGAAPTCSETDYTVTQNTDNKYFEISGIPAVRLDKAFDVVTDSGNITVCGLTYSLRALNDSGNTDKPVTLNYAKALVMYNRAAKSYFIVE